MKIYAYLISCDNLIADKRNYLPESYTVLEGVTRDSVIDIVNPRILVSSDCPVNCNYCYIENFARYYYVTVDIVRAGLYLLSMHCDVLTSHISDIKSAKAVSSRTKEAGETDNINLYVKDRDLPMYAYTEDTVHIIGSFTDKWNAGAYVCTVG